jgi:hypothetical protein
MLTRGTPVILNDVDAPEARLVAVLERYDDQSGVWYARYLSTYPNMKTCWTSGSLGGPTPLSEFGVRLDVDGDKFRVVQTGSSSATYRDGKPRNWQDRTGREWWPVAARAARLVSTQ